MNVKLKLYFKGNQLTLTFLKLYFCGNKNLTQIFISLFSSVAAFLFHPLFEESLNIQHSFPSLFILLQRKIYFLLLCLLAAPFKGSYSVMFNLSVTKSVWGPFKNLFTFSIPHGWESGSLRINNWFHIMQSVNTIYDGF